MVKSLSMGGHEKKDSVQGQVKPDEWARKWKKVEKSKSFGH